MSYVIKCERCGNIQDSIVKDDPRFPYLLEDMRERSKRGMMLVDPLCDKKYMHLCDHCNSALNAFLANWPLEAESVVDKVNQEVYARESNYRAKSDECDKLTSDNKTLRKTIESLQNDKRILNAKLAEEMSKTK